MAGCQRQSPTTCQADAGGTGCFPNPTSPRLMRHRGNPYTVGQRAPEHGPLDLLCPHGEEGPLAPVGLTECLRHSEMPSGYLQGPETKGRAGASRGPLYSDGVRTKILLPSLTIMCSFAAVSLPPTSCTEYIRQPQRTKCNVSSCITNEGLRL